MISSLFDKMEELHSGLNVLLHAGTDLLVGGDLSIATDIGNLTNGANIEVLAAEILPWVDRLRY